MYKYMKKFLISSAALGVSFLFAVPAFGSQLAGWPAGNQPVNINGCPVVSLAANACSIDGGLSLIGCNELRECDPLTGEYHCEVPVPFEPPQISLPTCTAEHPLHIVPPMGKDSPGCAIYPNLCVFTSVDSPPSNSGSTGSGSSGGGTSGGGTGIPTNTTPIPPYTGSSGSGDASTLSRNLNGALSGFGQILSNITGSSQTGTTGAPAGGAAAGGGTSASTSQSCSASAGATLASSLQTLQGAADILSAGNLNPALLGSVQSLIAAVAQVLSALSQCIGS